MLVSGQRRLDRQLLTHTCFKPQAESYSCVLCVSFNFIARPMMQTLDPASVDQDIRAMYVEKLLVWSLKVHWLTHARVIESILSKLMIYFSPR